MRLLKRPVRILAVMGKEVVEVLRRPRALASIMIGPVLILAIFGFGFIGQQPLRAVVVVPPGLGLPADPTAYRDVDGGPLTITGVVADPAAGRDRLRHGDVDLVLIVPPDARDQIAGGHQAVIRVEYDTVNPYEAFLAGTAASQLSAAVNRRIIEEAAAHASQQVAATGGTVPPELRPELAGAPTRAEPVDLAPSTPSIVAFYGLAVLALIVQHVTVTIAALSTMRDRQRGLIDLFRISPVGGSDLLIGKYLALALLGTGIGLVVLAVFVVGFGVPFLAAPAPILVTLALLVLASTGIGIVIALVADTDRQAVQLALLLLLASVFFSGLALDLSQFAQPVQAGAELLPVTQASRLLQDLLLRGGPADAVRIGALTAMTVILFLVGWVALRRLLVHPA